MSAIYASYFAQLLRDHDCGEDQEVPLPELVDDNARLPSPCFGQLAMGTESEVLGSCHTRSTTSTYASTISDNSSHSVVSAGSAGSNSSTGSCRWDSNPSSKLEKTDQLRRPKRPGRKTSDSNKNRSTKVNSNNNGGGGGGGGGSDRPVERPSRSNSNQGNKRNDKPQRPSRTSSAESKQRGGSRSNNKSKGLHQLSSSSADSLDKMLLQCSKHKALSSSRSTSSGESDSTSNSENSLKEIFRTASHQQRRTVTNVKPLPGTRTSPPRTVNEILGQSMEELKIAW